MKPPAGQLPPRVKVWLLLVVRLALITLGASAALQIPLPVLENWLPVREVAVVILAIALAGKCLYDTLFFDRYWP